MKNSNTPKIVVGVALAAIYATALAALLPRGGHDNAVADNASVVPAAQVAPEPAAPESIAAVSSDASSSAGDPSTDQILREMLHGCCYQVESDHPEILQQPGQNRTGSLGDRSSETERVVRIEV